ncbi:MAG: hypothetical protein Q4D98_03545 [Planctomycetia bacterium]|nr:hypothetical protein [Planctomycetia bacterium]
MNDVTKLAYEESGTVMSVSEWIPMTRQQIFSLCEKNPKNPVAMDLLAAVEKYPDGTVSHVLPISIQAVEENRTVQVVWKMEKVIHPATKKSEYKKVKTLVLGPKCEENHENDI